MGIRLRDRKLLWVRSGNRCAFRGCERKLALQAEDETVQDTIVSSEAHIIARSMEGPRGASPLTAEERDTYENLILLCLEHHKIVDDDPGTWTVEELLRMKETHEASVEAAMSPADQRASAQELIYASIISRWVVEADIEDWEKWTSWFLAVRPHGPKECLSKLDTLSTWLFSRPWPGRYPEVDAAFENLRRISHDLAMVLAYTADPEYEDEYEIDTFHKKELVKQEVYDRLAEQFEWIVDLIHDLIFELTRAAENVIENVRYFLDPLFQVEQGRLTVSRQGAGFYFKTYRPHYSVDETSGGGPYQGLGEFLQARSKRDVSFGLGVDEDAYRRVTPIVIGEDGPATW